MEKTQATTAFFALSQQTRLDIFRMLVQSGAHGRHAGEMAAMLGIRPNTLSNNLAILLDAGLIARHREGRNIRYTANSATIRDLLSFLLEGCCQARPEICFPLIERTSRHIETPMDPETYNVLFLCTGNSARSLLAESILNYEGGGRFRAFSAGSHPSPACPHPLAMELLDDLGHDTSALRSKSWDEFGRDDAPRIDIVLTVCDNAAAEICPIWPGQPMSAHWGVPDPAAVAGTEAERHRAFANAFKALHTRILALIDLPVATLDRVALQRRLDAIGRIDDPGSAVSKESR